MNQVEQFLDKCVRERIQNPEALGDAMSYLDHVSPHHRRKHPPIQRWMSAKNRGHLARSIYEREQREEVNRDIAESE